MGDSGGTKEVKRLLGEQRCSRSENSCVLDSFLLEVLFYLINTYSSSNYIKQSLKTRQFQGLSDTNHAYLLVKPLHGMLDGKGQDKQPLLLYADLTEIMTVFPPLS